MKQKLNSEIHSKFCICCGLKSEAIWDNLQEQKWIDNKRMWKKHTQYMNMANEELPYFYPELKVAYCGNCGKKLKNNEISKDKSKVDEKTYEIIVSGYECSKCEYNEVF